MVPVDADFGIAVQGADFVLARELVGNFVKGVAGGGVTGGGWGGGRRRGLVAEVGGKVAAGHGGWSGEGWAELVSGSR